MESEMWRFARVVRGRTRVRRRVLRTGGALLRLGGVLMLREEAGRGFFV
jgi:hypothetical protein